jgi:glycosyltransferase involved in cell wall biosynthesis
MATTVIIPARNEENSIGPIVGAFSMHEHAFEVYVAVDGDTTDKTAQVALEWGGIPLPYPRIRGKGQLVAAAVFGIGRAGFLSHRIVLCDGDYAGLTFDHINLIIGPQDGMTIGIPDWPECDVPSHVTNAWPQVSGFRCLPHTMIPDDAHGYLLETQLNLRAIRDRMPIRQRFMTGLKAPFQWPLAPKRKAEMERDREWGLAHGVH